SLSGEPLDARLPGRERAELRRVPEARHLQNGVHGEPEAARRIPRRVARFGDPDARTLGAGIVGIRPAALLRDGRRGPPRRGVASVRRARWTLRREPFLRLRDWLVPAGGRQERGRTARLAEKGITLASPGREDGGRPRGRRPGRGVFVPFHARGRRRGCADPLA